MTHLARLWTLVLCLFTLPAVAADGPIDWPVWRGPEQNGVSRETGLVEKWDPSGENVVWKNTELGTRSTPIIMNGKLYTLAPYHMHKPDEGERVMCADAATGKVLWESKFNVYLSDVPRERVAWSCVVGDPSTNRVYAMGVCGFFQCLDGDTGKTIWSRALSEEFGLLSTYGGRTNQPIIFEDLVIISAVMVNWGENAIPAHRFLAMKKDTGEVVWFNGTNLRPNETTYSMPMLSHLNGQAALVFGSGDGRVWAFQPRTGKPIWSYHLSRQCVNVPPVVLPDGRVFCSNGEENPDGASSGMFVCIDGNKAVGGADITENGAIWKKKEIMVGRAGMVVVNERVYAGDDSGNVFVFDAKTGEQIGKRVKLAGTIMRSSLLYGDGKIYASTLNVFHVLKLDDKAGVKIVNRIRFPQQEEVHASPITYNGRLYYTTTEAIYCLGDATAQTGRTPLPPATKEAELADKTPATVQITPAESLIKPGEKVQYTVKLFNALGQPLGEAKGTEFTVETEGPPKPPVAGAPPGPPVFTIVPGPGTIDAAGLYTAASDNVHTGVTIKAKVGDIVGKARIRIVPPLPWKFDFANKKIPLPWNGMRYRHVPREVDGDAMMVKISTIPLGMKSMGTFGWPDLHDYTIQADLRGSFGKNNLTDMGVIAQRYALDMMGNKQVLQIRSWTAQLDRFSKQVPFTWKQDVWYTVKFQAAVKDGKAILKGKVWERGQPEPSAWSIEAEDPAPNVTGSPGLFGNATNGEIFIDNISVTPNP